MKKNSVLSSLTEYSFDQAVYIYPELNIQTSPILTLKSIELKLSLSRWQVIRLKVLIVSLGLLLKKKQTPCI